MPSFNKHKLIARTYASLADAALCATIFLITSISNVKANSLPLPIQSNVAKSIDNVNHVLHVKSGLEDRGISPRIVQDYWQYADYKYDDSTGTLTIKGGTLNNPLPIYQLLPNVKNSIKQINITGKLVVNGSAEFLFGLLPNLTKINGLENIDTSDVTNMRYLFQEDAKLDNVDLSGWNTSKVNNMRDMFYCCYSLTNLNVSKLDTGNVTDMYGMFNECYKLTNIDVSNWKTGNVTTMYGMFNKCNNLNNLNVKDWDTKNVTDMSATFNNCYQLTSLDASNWDTSSVTQMYAMFQSCIKLADLNIKNWNTDKVTAMGWMFYGCKDLTKLDLSNFNDQRLIKDSQNYDGHHDMLSGLTSLKQLAVSKNFNLANTNFNTDGIWVSVGSGTIEQPLGDESYTASDLAKFWNNKNYTETWVRETKHNVTINYIDLDDNNKIIKTDSLSSMGVRPIDYKSNFDKIVTNLKDKHYEYVASEDKLPWFNGKVQLPSNVVSNVTYTIGFRHTKATLADGDKNPVTGDTITGLTKTITQTIKYTGAPSPIADDVQKIIFKRNAAVDMVTGKVTYLDWSSATQTFKDVTSPNIAGYNPDITSVKGTTVMPNSSDITKEVKYTRKNYKITIDYVDSQDNNKVIKSDTVTGNSEKVIAYKDQMTSIINSLTGYIVDKSKSSLPLNSNGDIQLPSDVLADKTYTVVLIHKTNTIKDGDKNPVTGDLISGLAKTITQTIRYTGTNKNIPDHITKVVFTRNATVDLISGNVTYLKWNKDSQTFSAVPSPKAEGYTANPETVKAQVVKPTDSDITTVVKYTRNSYSISIDYVDSNTGKVIKTDKVSGNPDKIISYQDQLKQIMNNLSGYTIDKDKTTLPLDSGNNIKLPNSVTGDKNYQVILKHQNKTVHLGDKNPVTEKDIDGLKKTVTQTIKYTGVPTAISDNVQTVTFKRDADVDMVTGKLTYHDWDNKELSFKDVNSPKVIGYEPDSATIKGTTVKPTDSDVTKEVKYSRGSYNIKIDYVDSNDNDKVIKTDKVVGNPDKVISYRDQLKQILHDLSGYVIDNDKTTLPLDNNNDIKLPADVTGDKNYQVILKHDSKTMHAGDKNLVTGKDEDSLTKTITQTIKYRGADKNILDNVQTVKFTRNGKVDLVTGKVEYLDWNEGQQSFKDVTSPTIAGYSVDIKTVKGTTVKPTDSDVTKIVTYTKVNSNEPDYNITINYQDENGKIVETDKQKGKTNSTIPYKNRMKEIMAGLAKEGYEIDQDKSNLPLDENDDIKLGVISDNTIYKLVLKHKIMTFKYGEKNPFTDKEDPNLERKVTQTIEYHGSGQALPYNVQALTFTRSAQVDMVTGKVEYLKWNEDKQQFKDVKSPFVKDYVADLPMVKGRAVTGNSKDIVQIVTYHKSNIVQTGLDIAKNSLPTILGLIAVALVGILTYFGLLKKKDKKD